MNFLHAFILQPSLWVQIQEDNRTSKDKPTQESKAKGDCSKSQVSHVLVTFDRKVSKESEYLKCCPHV